MAAFGIAATALTLLAASASAIQLGMPAFLAGVATTVLVLFRTRCRPMTLARNVLSGVLPLVAGLFVLVEALERTGATTGLARLLNDGVQRSATLAAWVSGVAERWAAT